MNTRFLLCPPRSLLLGASLSLLTLVHSPVRAQDAAANGGANAPRTALVTSLRGAEMTLDVGTQQNAVRGAVFSIAREGRVRARVQITEVRENDSAARILSADDDFVLAVGDTLQFQSVQPVAEAPAQPAPPAQPATPPQPAQPVTPVQPVTPPAPQPQSNTPPITTPPVTVPQPAAPAQPPVAGGSTAGVVPVAAGTTVSATITAINGTSLTFDAGADKGVRSGSRVAIARNGDVVALARIMVVEASRSTGEIIFSDPASGGAQVGDVAPLLASTGSAAPLGTGSAPAQPSSSPAATAPSLPVPRGSTPATPVSFETGASDEVVPRADESYDYLAALASSKLLPREYPAYLFHDEGSRRHRTEEDLTLSRAQIATLTLGALRAARANVDAGGNSSISGRVEAALRALGGQYQRELQVLGATPDELQAIGLSASTRPRSTSSASVASEGGSGGSGSGSVAGADVGAGAGTGAGSGHRFVIGVSGREQASVLSGSGRDLGSAPFSERQGGLRLRSGLDTRTNIFGSVGPDLRFFGRIDGGSRVSATEKGGLSVNEAFVEFNAHKLLRGLRIEAGRDEIWWGPGHFGTLLLSDNAGPLNLIQTTFERGSYRLQGLYAPIDRGPLGGSRSLYGHNVSVQIGNQARIGFAETLLLPRNRLDAVAFGGAFSPIPLFTLERLRNRNTSASNGNILTEAYIETSLARGVRGTGEFLIDDLGVNANNILRDRLGALLGVHVFTPRDPSRLGLFAEFANLQGRTYLALRSPNDSDYYYRRDPLGYPVAPVPGAAVNGGAQSLRLEAYWRPQARLRVGGGLELADLNSEDAFRTRQQIIRLRASYDLSRNFTLVGRLQRTTTDSPNLAAGTRTQNVLQLEVVRTY